MEIRTVSLTRSPTGQDVRHRLAVRGQFSGRYAPKVRGVSDVVAIATTQNVKAARQAEREWKRTLSRGQRRKLRSA